MFVYEQSFQGKRHIQKGIPCQDCCGHCFTPNGWIVAAVADGVSASPLAEEGANIAVKSCLEYLSGFKYSPFLDAEGIQSILRDSFNYALRCIKESDNPGNSIPFSKMTTLQVLLYHKKIGLHWGQAGDGTLIVRNITGDWKQISFPMKNSDNKSPITLQDEIGAWKFGSVQAENLGSILMTTDGVAEILNDGTDDKETNKHVVNYLMDPHPDKHNKQEIDSYYQQLFFAINDERERCNSLENNIAHTRLLSITDDITILLIGDLSSLEYESFDLVKNAMNQSQRMSNSSEHNNDTHTTDGLVSMQSPCSVESTADTFGSTHRYRTSKSLQSDRNESADGKISNKILLMLVIILCFILAILGLNSLFNRHSHKETIDIIEDVNVESDTTAELNEESVSSVDDSMEDRNTMDVSVSNGSEELPGEPLKVTEEIENSAFRENDKNDGTQ